MKTSYCLVVVVALLAYANAQAMVGGPLFCVGRQVTSMTVEAEQSNMKVPMSDLMESEAAQSRSACS